MKFEIFCVKSINEAMRLIGYKPAYFSRWQSHRGSSISSGQKAGEVSVVRPLGRNDYPRFHLYIEEDGKNLIFKLHLDQKKPSYKGSSAHGGEYDGPLINEEADRIKKLLGFLL